MMTWNPFLQLWRRTLTSSSDRSRGVGRVVCRHDRARPQVRRGRHSIRSLVRLVAFYGRTAANVFFGGAFYGRGAAEEIFGVAFYEPILCVFDIKVLQVVLVYLRAIPFCVQFCNENGSTQNIPQWHPRFHTIKNNNPHRATAKVPPRHEKRSQKMTGPQGRP